MPGQPLQDAGRSRSKIVDTHAEHAVLQLRGLHFREALQLLHAESLGIVQFNGEHVGDRQQAVKAVQGVVGDNLAMIDDDDAVAEALGFLHVVRGVDQGLATLLEGFKVFEDSVTALRIDADGGLVEQQNLRIVQQRSRQVEPAFHPATEGPDLVPGAVGEAHQSQRIGDRAFRSGAVQIVKRGEKDKVVERRQLVIQCHVLRNQADFSLDRVSIPAQGTACNEHLAGIGPQQASDDRNGSRFSRAVGPQQPHRLSRSRPQADTIDGDDLSIALVQSLYFEHEGRSVHRLQAREGADGWFKWANVRSEDSAVVSVQQAPTPTPADPRGCGV